MRVLGLIDRAWGTGLAAKEWREARYKILAATAIVLLAALVPRLLMPYGTVRASAAPEVLRPLLLGEMWGLYVAGGFYVLLPLSALLGAGLVSGEASGGTMPFLLSRPVSRTRVLLTKYSVCAVILLAGAASGGTLVVLSAAVRGYPVFDLVGAPGVALSAVLMWLGALFVLGVALLASTILRGVVSSVAASAATVVAILALPNLAYAAVYNLRCWRDASGLDICIVPYGPFEKLTLYSYWYSHGLYAGKSLTATDFLVSSVAAALPLLVALWLFRRKEY